MQLLEVDFLLAVLPSISDQIQTAQVQTNTVLSLSQDMGSTSGTGGSTQTVSNVTTVITPMPIFDSTPQVVNGRCASNRYAR